MHGNEDILHPWILWSGGDEVPDMVCGQLADWQFAVSVPVPLVFFVVALLFVSPVARVAFVDPRPVSHVVFVVRPLFVSAVLHVAFDVCPPFVSAALPVIV